MWRCHGIDGCHGIGRCHGMGTGCHGMGHSTSDAMAWCTAVVACCTKHSSRPLNVKHIPITPFLFVIKPSPPIRSSVPSSLEAHSGLLSVIAGTLAVQKRKCCHVPPFQVIRKFATCVARETSPRGVRRDVRSARFSKVVIPEVAPTVGPSRCFPRHAFKRTVRSHFLFCAHFFDVAGHALMITPAGR
jgi:hypothetical protein